MIAPSFGDIFAANAVNNGLLPARVSEADAEMLLTLAAQDDLADLRIDLDARTITTGNQCISFGIEPVWRTRLLNGWDDLDLTLSHRAAIDRFQDEDRMRRPWAGVLAQGIVL